MQANLAVAFIETSSIAKGIEASDAMCKTAEVKLHKTVVIARGKYIIIVSGTTGEVESALRAGLAIAGKTVIHSFIIRNVHQQVLDALDKRQAVEKLESVGIIETKEAAPAFHAADAAAKAASVKLLEVKTVAPGGKGWVTMTGEVGAVRSAVAAGIKVVPEDMLVSQVIIPLAHEQLLASLTK